VQGLVNSFNWGLDHCIHAATSSAGASLHSLVDPGHPTVELRGRDFALDPRTHQVWPTSGGGQHGLSFNRWGEKFVCSNSDHLQQVLVEDRYLSCNPYATPLASRVSIAADSPQAAVYRSSPVEPWRIIRTQLRVSGTVPGPIEGGGTPAGYFTGATGVTIYRGSAWPSTYLDYALVCDVGSNLVHRKRLIEEGTRYRGERVDDHCEFITSDDIWFRPVQLANAPDGTIYIIDMYREVIEHPASLPPMIKRHLDLTSGRNRGRIYRIVPEDFARPPAPRMSRMTTAELVATLAHPNGWHRDTASRLIYERQDASVSVLLQTLLKECPLAEGRLHALYALASLGNLTRDDLLMALADQQPHVRRHAVRLAERVAQEDSVVRQAMLNLANDADVKVRCQLAYSLSALPDSPQRSQALARLARRAIPDAYALAAVQTALLDGSVDMLDQLTGDPMFRRDASGRAFLLSLAQQIRRQENARDLARLNGLIQKLADQQVDLLPELLMVLAHPRDSRVAQQLREGTAGPIIDRIIERACHVSIDVNSALPERIAAIDHLALADWQDVSTVYQHLLEASQPQPIQLRAIDSLGRQSSPQVGRQLLDGWDAYSPALRSPLIGLLMSRVAWQAHLLDALESHQIALQELTAAQQQQLARHASSQRWQALTSDKQSAQPGLDQVLQAYRQALDAHADPAAGRQLFRTLCASCHRLEDVGTELGPNLAAMQNRGSDAILINVLDPNREVNPQYVAYSAVTNDGRIVTGIIRAETATSIELVQADGKSETLLRDEIESLTSTNQSLMPTGLDKQVTPTAMNDLIGYLRSLAL
jgi:putative membrane-bound dehydrogenase-like protein